MLSSTQELETVAVNRDAVGNNDDARLLRESIASPLQGHDMKDGIRRFRMSMFTLLWLYPDVSVLTSALLEKLEASWDYDSAFLLGEILKLQIIYRDYLGDVTSTGSALGDSALLRSDEVERVIRTLSSTVVAYRPGIFDNLLSREVQFKILALSLILSRSLGILSYSDALSDELQKTLVEQLKVASQIRPSTAEDGEKTGYSLGQDSLYVRWALDSLAEPSGKHDSQRPLYEGIATLFFIVDPPIQIDFVKGLAQLQPSYASADQSTRLIPSFHVLYRLALGIVSLSRYASTIEDQGTRETVTEKSKEIAVHLVMKIESLFRTEYTKLQRLLKVRKAIANVRIGKGATYLELTSGTSDAAFDLLHIVNYLATEFGALKCFRIIRKLCSDLIEQCLGTQDLQPLRFKALEVLLSVTQATTGFLKKNTQGSLPPSSPLQAVGLQSPSSEVLRMLDISQALYIARQDTNVRSTKCAMAKLQTRSRRAPKNSDTEQAPPNINDHRIFTSTRSENEMIGPHEQEPDSISIPETSGEHGECNASLHASKSPTSASSASTSSEPPLYSDIKHQLTNDEPEIRQINQPRTFDLLAELDGEERPRSRFHLARGLRQGIHPNTVQELSAERPTIAHARLQSYLENHGAAAVSTRPGVDCIAVQSPTLPVPHVSPLSPTVPFIPPLTRASASTETASQASTGHLKPASSNFHAQRVEVADAKKVKFLRNSKRADYVTISPDCAYAAFVFSDQVQVCRIISEWKGIQTLEIKVMLKLENKKAGKFVAAHLSNTHLVAISNKEIHVCRYTPLKLSPSSPVVRQFDRDVCANCVAISPASNLIAVGQRVKANGPNRGPIRYYAAIQLYSLDLIPEAILKCQAASDQEFPRHVSFYSDGQAMLYGNNKTFGLWTRVSNGWTETALGSLEAKGPGAKGITSITPISLLPLEAGSPLPRDPPISALDHLNLKYFVVTSTLSNIAENAASYTSSVRGNHAHSNRSLSLTPWCEHFYRSAVSPDGRLAAFLTDSGRLKLGSLVFLSSSSSSSSSPSDPDSSRLQIRNIPNGKFQAKKEPEATDAGRIGIREEADGFVVTMVDRHGTVMDVRVVEAKKRPTSRERQMSGQTESSGNMGLSNSGGGTATTTIVSELPDRILSIRH